MVGRSTSGRCVSPAVMIRSLCQRKDAGVAEVKSTAAGNRATRWRTIVWERDEGANRIRRAYRSGQCRTLVLGGARAANADSIFLSAVREGIPAQWPWAFLVVIDLNSSKDPKSVSREILDDGPRGLRHMPSKCRQIVRNSRAIYRELSRMVRGACNRWRT